MNSRIQRRSYVALVSLLVLPSLAAAQVQTDPDLPHYVAGEEKLSGKIRLVGSDWMNNIVTLWGAEFEKRHPGVQIVIEGKGSSTATAALIAGRADIGTISRPLKEKELAAFEEKFGYPPTQILVGCEMLAVFVHARNPLTQLERSEVDAIFSATRKLGGGNLEQWNQLLPPAAPMAKLSIHPYGRNSLATSYGIFKSKGLNSGDFKPSVQELPGSAAIVRQIAVDTAGCGYAGIAYQAQGVRAVPLVAGGKPVTPTAENIDAYPLTQKFYLVLNVPPQEQIDPLRREFLKFVLSGDGQDLVAQDGLVPLAASSVKRERQRANIADAAE
ncbi:substrate-binding domain-containing protein [Blastopirellula sp. JC732]|uniref:Substrate-binding domain-containing protein n=1 Tax=Blastopirellula sediminis TaxID=2894196 RepID=A0A9X1MQK9_9BACT|nr:substrate-binding domain-containing protein [Blastopirellula sediminis]MCC9605629.1 substrate-binding domain-containing protein [Blastopirellula sediminis]MCC9631071.1 substrate-binding domain-containing protein [Blastopirellula sediminis]